MTAPERSLVLWVPDWPILAWLREHPNLGDPTASPQLPLALISKQRVSACSGAARAAGVRIGMRESEAQGLLPDLLLAPHLAENDARHFATVFAALTEAVPGVELLAPGLCRARSRGPSRYYGSEAAACLALASAATGGGAPEARIGLADTAFAAELAARAPSHTIAARGPGIVSTPEARVRIVAPAATAAFLAPFPVAAAAADRLAELLRSLGIRTLGALAALPEDAVRQRFGPEGVAAHRRSRGLADEPSPERPAASLPEELHVELEFDPPIDSAEQLAFTCATLVAHLHHTLREARLVCTELRIELTDDSGARHEREWAHPRYFTENDTLDRLRWQTSALPRTPERNGAGVSRARLTPVRTEAATTHEPTLWSTEPDARVHHRMSRLQGKLGHRGVLTAQLTGGRLLSERQRLRPWGSAAPGDREAASSASAPWPGSLPEPTPITVFTQPIPAVLLDAAHHPVTVTDGDLLATDPAILRAPPDAPPQRITAWSLPWPVRARWWEGQLTRIRLQLVTEVGEAWILIAQRGAWFAEGRYD